MTRFAELLRKSTTLIIAVYFWLHAAFLFDFHSEVISQVARFARLSSAEVTIFVLLLGVSWLTGSGFSKSLASAAYIYFFPFVVLWYAAKWTVALLSKMQKWASFPGQPSDHGVEILDSQVKPRELVAFEHISLKETLSRASRLFLKPFQGSTVLWCALLLVTSHPLIAWGCLLIISAQLARKLVLTIRVAIVSDYVLGNLAGKFFAGLEKTLASFSTLPANSPIDAKIKTLLSEIGAWTKLVGFLKEPARLSQWVSVCTVFLIVCVHLYFAFFFSFVYYGIARVSGIAYTWPTAFVVSTCMPFLITELPRNLMAWLAGTLQCLCVLTLGIGTVINYVHRRIAEIQIRAGEFSVILADPAIKDKFVLLQGNISNKN